MERRSERSRIVLSASSIISIQNSFDVFLLVFQRQCGTGGKILKILTLTLISRIAITLIFNRNNKKCGLQLS